MSEIVKEAVRAYHRMIDIVEYEQRNRAANLMAPSEIVNTEQVQKPQTKKVLINAILIIQYIFENLFFFVFQGLFGTGNRNYRHRRRQKRSRSETDSKSSENSGRRREKEKTSNQSIIRCYNTIFSLDDSLSFSSVNNNCLVWPTRRE